MGNGRGSPLGMCLQREVGKVRAAWGAFALEGSESGKHGGRTHPLIEEEEVE